MKILFTFSFTLALLAACTKQERTPIEKPAPDPVRTLPELMITELHDVEVRQGTSQAIDLDKDGKRDIIFSTWYIGNPNQNEDEILFFASSGITSSLMVAEDNGSPRFGRDEMIGENPANGHEWYILSLAEMAMKNIGFVGVPYWEKAWINATHKFLALRIHKNNELFYGWVEVTMDTANSKLILHRAAIGMVAGKPVKTGI